MAHHILRSTWIPADEAALLDAYRTGLLEERNWCDLKAIVHFTKGGKTELARDLASFSIDGGTLIIGLNEDEPDGSPLTPVDLGEVTAERIEQVASMKIDPPLTVQCTTVEAPAKDGAGYVLVHVPASPLAPHQVEGKYQGRSDKTKRYLSDTEVARYMQIREAAEARVEEDLRRFCAEDPYESGSRAHLFLLARPLSGNRELARPLMDADYQPQLHRLINESRAHQLINTLLAECFPKIRVEPRVDLGEVNKTAHGIRSTPFGFRDWDRSKSEQYTAILDLYEDGTLRYYDSRHSAELVNSFHGTHHLGVPLDLLAMATREMLALAVELSRQQGFAGTWQLGVAVTNILGACNMPTRNGWRPDVFGPGYTEKSYENVSRASVAELESHPGRVAERLLGRLWRSLANGPLLAFKDQAAEQPDIDS